MPRPDDGLIHAWLDGELAPEEAARVEALVASDPEWAAAAAEARGLIAASSRILSALDDVPGDVIPVDAAARGGGGSDGGGAPVRRESGLRVRPWMRLAAGIVLVAGVGYAARGALSDRNVRTDVTDVATATQEMSTTKAAAASEAAATASTAAAPTTGAGSGASATRVADATDLAVPIPPSDRQRAEAPTPAPVPKAMALPAAPPAADLMSERRALDLARTESTPQRFAGTERLSQVVVTGAAQAEASAVLEGCWHTRTAAGADTMLRDLQLKSMRGDTLVVVVDAAGTEVRAVREGDRLRAAVREAATRDAARAAGVATPRFEATRVTCPPTPEP